MPCKLKSERPMFYNLQHELRLLESRRNLEMQQTIYTTLIFTLESRSWEPMQAQLKPYVTFTCQTMALIRVLGITRQPPHNAPLHRLFSQRSARHLSPVSKAPHRPRAAMIHRSFRSMASVPRVSACSAVPSLLAAGRLRPCPEPLPLLP